MKLMFAFFRCVGEAVCSKGLRGLLGEVPLVDTLLSVAEDAWKLGSKIGDAVDFAGKLKMSEGLAHATKSWRLATTSTISRCWSSRALPS